jgi:hypothetical protein
MAKGAQDMMIVMLSSIMLHELARDIWRLGGRVREGKDGKLGG